MTRTARRAAPVDPNVKPLTPAALAEARVVLARAREKVGALGDIDMAVARLEIQRAQAREAVAREEQELNALLQKEAARLGIADGPAAERWRADLAAGVFRRVRSAA